jgi:peptidylprolyl isomerase
MLEAKNGDVVKVHYTGKHTGGDIFDSSVGREPLEFELGRGMMIQGFEQGILGMKTGEEKTIDLSPEQAYGEINPEMHFTVSRQEIPTEIDLQIGIQLQAHTEAGQPIQVLVKEIHDNSIILDANHPLAGHKLTFNLTLIDITPKDEADKKPLLFD